MSTPPTHTHSHTEIPISTSLELVAEDAGLPKPSAAIAGVDLRTVVLSALAIALAVVCAGVAELLMRLIGLFTHLAFYQEFVAESASPAGAPHWGVWIIAVPVVGGVIVGLMARYGSKAIRGHGIPEAMEQILINGSRIPARITFLKPLSAAVSIGTGGPFGAEGPIIATGGALGSVLGQLLKITATERKTLLAAGAAAGMTATFGSPISAVLLAIELLLFEFKPRSLIPVAFAAATAAAARLAWISQEPAFATSPITDFSPSGLPFYILIGALVGVASVGITRIVYAIEDQFEHLPIHWMWWPAIGGLAVGIVGYFEPRTLGVGYDNITQTISGGLPLTWLAIFCVLKFVSWSLSLGSGTSGGTLAPLFTIGGGIGYIVGSRLVQWFPQQGISPRIAAIVGMASIFAGASRAVLASAVFAYETTQQPVTLLPLLAGCMSAYLVSLLLMKNTIMTEKIVRRGLRVPSEYGADFLDHVHVRDFASRIVRSLPANATLREAREKILSGEEGYSHQGFPIIDENGQLLGVLTRRDLLPASGTGAQGAALVDTTLLRDLIKRKPIVIHEDDSLRNAADLMTRTRVGRLPVVRRENPRVVTAILTRSDILASHQLRLREQAVVREKLRI